MKEERPHLRIPLPSQRDIEEFEERMKKIEEEEREKDDERVIVIDV